MESMKQKFFRAAVPLVMLAVSAALSVFVYRLPQPVREPLPVLMYHHMVPDGQDCNDMTVTPGKFRADLETVLAMGYTPVLPRELAAGDALPEKPILITFDDGYRSNYDLVYPILREYGVKACISIIVLMPDLPADNFCFWSELQEMTDSGLVEIGSHSYRLHNLDEDSGNYDAQGANGVERRAGESDADFKARVLDDIQLSHDRIVEKLGGEKIDIVKWSEDISEFISAALSPAKVVKVELLPGETRSCRVTVPDQQLSLAIGNKGQNARLCARLTGYNIDIRPESGYYGEEEPKKEAETDTE